ncbi:hypothetical protein MASR1M60_31170 [Rhodocyclaceae bacterium]
MSIKPLSIFIVDDEPAARLTASFPFCDPHYQISEFADGNSFLSTVEQNQDALDVVLLDIEMPGMNGIDVCRSLRETTGWQGPVIFVSCHDDMETRLHAYDAGGSDYIVKPFNADELLQKVKVAEKVLIEKRGFADQVALASRTAFTAMSSMGELGMIMQFLRTSFSCTTCARLAKELLDVVHQYGLEGLVDLRIDGEEQRISTHGACTPLELSILQHGRGMGHQFQFRDRLVINYPSITLVVSKLPMADPDAVGRLRDNLAILAEGASARLVALSADAAFQRQGHGIQAALGTLTAMLADTEQQQAAYRISALTSIDEYILALEHSFVHLELTNKQEEALAGMARQMAENLGQKLGDSREVSDKLHSVIKQLQQLTA